MTKIYGCQIIVSESAIVQAREFINDGSDRSNSNSCLLLKCDLERETEDGFISTNFQPAVLDNCDSNNNDYSNNYYYRWIDRVMPRGKQQAIEIYEVWAATSPDSPKKHLTQTLFDKGIQAWQAGKFVAALGYFQQLLEQNPADTVAAYYRERCQEKLGLIPENKSSEFKL